jgi:hypothetical protein
MVTMIPDRPKTTGDPSVRTFRRRPLPQQVGRLLVTKSDINNLLAIGQREVRASQPARQILACVPCSFLAPRLIRSFGTQAAERAAARSPRRLSTLSQSMFTKNASMYCERSDGL